MDANSALMGAGVCAALGAYHHALYPAAMALLGRKDPMPKQTTETFPTIDVLMPAYNEAAFIAAKIDALAAQTYPTVRIRVLIGCDGCRDGTAEAARRAAARHPRLKVDIRDFPTNRGKTIVLNELIQSATAEIIVFSDVSALPEPDALRRAADYFTDPVMGAVGGGYALPVNAGRGERLYWRYQTAVKRGECRVAGLIGAHGAFYAVRRVALRTLPNDTINDDFIIPVRIAATGWKTVYDPSISVKEVDVVTEQADSRRRRRIGAGNLQQILRLAGPVLGSGQLGLILALTSGKALRVAMGPLFLLGLAFLGLAALQSPLALVLLILVALTSVRGPGRYAANGHIQSMIGAFGYLAGGYRRWHRVSDQALSQSTPSNLAQ